MRLLGSPWPEIAAEVGHPEAEVCQWPRRFDALWYRALRRAERRAHFTAGLEALAALRGLLRSDDEKTRRDAAKMLADIRLKSAARRPKGPEAKGKRPALEDLDDAELERLIAGG